MSEFMLRIHPDELGRTIMIDEFPELKLLYVAYKNRICPHYFNEEEPCNEPGGVELELAINGTHKVMLHSSDAIRDHAVVVGEYEFRGSGVIIYHHSRMATYFILTITRYVASSANNSANFGTETRTYRQGCIFMLEFTESGGTGHTWHLKLPKGLEMLEQSYIPHCEETDEDDQRPGCVNTHRFVLKGVEKGQFFIDATYSRLWEEYGKQQSDGGRRTRQYDIIIL